MLFIFDFISAVEKFSMVPLGRLKLCSTSQYGLLDHIISLYVPQVEITRKMSANSPYPAFAWITSQLSDPKIVFSCGLFADFYNFFSDLDFGG